MSIEDHDDQVTRCPRLGDFVPFKYCRTSGSPFCWVIINCWAARVDIGQFLADNYTPEVIHQGLTRPEPGQKIGKMVEMAKQWGKR
jgi:hypothetical protein